MGRSSFTGRCAPRNGRQGAGPCGCSTRSARQRTAVPRTWPPPTPMEGLPKLPWRGAEVVGPYGKSPQPPRQAAHSGASAPRMRRIGGSEAGITPKAPATPDNPSVALRATAPFTQGSLSLGGTGNMGTVGSPQQRAAEVVGPYGFSGHPPSRSGAVSGRDGSCQAQPGHLLLDAFLAGAHGLDGPLQQGVQLPA